MATFSSAGLDPRSLDQLDRDGFLIRENVVSAERVAELVRATQSLSAGREPGVLDRQGEIYGARDLVAQVPEVCLLADSPEIRSLVTPVLGTGAFVVRGLFFDKTTATNWNLPWHQDVTIAVVARQEVEGFGPWTRKAGIPHVHAPSWLLERMLTVRLHLDDCGPASGPMRVLPGSHAEGRLSPDGVARWVERARRDAIDCVVGAGGAVLMRPLILHASASANAQGHRRVIHLDYAAEALPGGLEWRHV
jgi:ectoine hydroxylase-related dioxygenase (phytanoyl-CoA dioxygenase family)